LSGEEPLNGEGGNRKGNKKGTVPVTGGSKIQNGLMKKPKTTSRKKKKRTTKDEEDR